MKMGWGNLVVLVVIVVLHAEVMRKSMGWLEDEKSALLHIKHSLFLQNASLGYPLLPSWDMSDPKSDSCEWEGVLCDSSSGHLITLSLSNLPATIYDHGIYYMNCPEYDSMSLNMSLFLPFHQLTTLNLSLNCFHRLFAIQDGQSKSTFSMLESLDLSWNPYLNESIINSLTALTSLKNLDLARCNISGPFPIQDGQSNSTFSMLESLDLSWNPLNESIIKSLSAFTSLKNLNLAGCDISGPFPIQDGRSNSIFPMLETLDLSNNGLKESSIIKFLGALTFLRNLYLANCDISGSFLMEDIHLLSNLTKLRTLDLRGNEVDKSIFKYLIALPTLKSLFLSENYQGMNGTPIYTDLCKMIELQELNLSDNDLTGTLDACLFET